MTTNSSFRSWRRAAAMVVGYFFGEPRAPRRLLRPAALALATVTLAVPAGPEVGR